MDLGKDPSMATKVIKGEHQPVCLWHEYTAPPTPTKEHQNANQSTLTGSEQPLEVTTILQEMQRTDIQTPLPGCIHKKTPSVGKELYKTYNLICSTKNNLFRMGISMRIKTNTI